MGRGARWFALVLLFGVLAVPPDATAQMVGVTGGASVATLTGDGAADDLETRTSVRAGVFTRYPLNDRLWIGPAIHYAEKGARDGSDDLETALSYLEIPVLLGFRVFEGARYDANLFAGPRVAFEVQCFQEVSFLSGGERGTGFVECDDVDPPFGTKTVDVGVIAGAGFTYSLTETVSLVVNGAIDVGLSSIDEGTNARDLTNRVYFFEAGLGWALGR